MPTRTNPRYSNGAARRKLTAMLRAEESPCIVCGKAIDYTLPAGHPMSFEVDEDMPVSRWREFGYPSAAACALDPSNVHAAHRCCNEWKGARTLAECRSASHTPSGAFVDESWA